MSEQEQEQFSNEVSELIDFASLDGCETGELCGYLCSVSQYPDYMSDDFYVSLKTEIRRHLKGFKANYKIVEREETFTRKVIDLEYIGK